MSNEIVSLKREGSISIITMDDGKANAFSSKLIAAFNGCLNDVPKDSGALVITGRANIFSGGFDLDTINSGDEEAAKLMRTGGLTLLPQFVATLTHKLFRHHTQRTRRRFVRPDYIEIRILVDHILHDACQYHAARSLRTRRQARRGIYGSWLRGRGDHRHPRAFLSLGGFLHRVRV